ncbi:MAG TPA: hypothetical protein VF755_08050 [Catenuloplanes sp.]|jgi:hypothetical protein
MSNEQPQSAQPGRPDRQGGSAGQGATTDTSDGAVAPPPAQATGGSGPDGADPTDTKPADTKPADSGPGGSTVDSSPSGGAEAATAADGPAADGPAADGWAAFAPVPPRVPGRGRRAARAVGRVAVHEYTLVVVGSLLLAVLMTWPTLRYPMYTIPQDIWDPTLQAWQLAWNGHILLTDPTQLWHTNAFFPDRYSLAFSDSLLGYAPFGMIGNGPAAAVLRYNIVFVLAHALAFVGAYALVRQVGAGRIGAAVAAVAFAYAPWRLAHGGHLNLLSSGGVPLALALLARGHGWSLRHGVRPERRHAGWTVAGWLVAAWQVTLGFGLGLSLSYVLVGIATVVVVTWAVRWVRPLLRRPSTPPAVPDSVPAPASGRPSRRLLLADLAGGVVFSGVTVLMALPYLKVVELYPYARRTVEDLKLLSPPPQGFLVAPAESRVWGAAHEQARTALTWPPEMALLPGFTLYALALGGLVVSIWTVRQRLLLLAGVVVSGVLALGTSLGGGRYTYLPLFDHLPGWSGIRTPGRLVLWTTLLLAILAAGAVSEFVRRVHDATAERVPARPGFWLRLATLLPLMLVLAEGLNNTPHPIVPAQPAALRTVEGPMLVLPSDPLQDQNIMFWTTTRFQPIVNGGSGFAPRRVEEVRQVVRGFPDQPSVDYLRGMGVKTVVLLRSRVGGTPWEAGIDLAVDGLGLRREDIEDAVVFRLS